MALKANPFINYNNGRLTSQRIGLLVIIEFLWLYGAMPEDINKYKEQRL